MQATSNLPRSITSNETFCICVVLCACVPEEEHSKKRDEALNVQVVGCRGEKTTTEKVRKRSFSCFRGSHLFDATARKDAVA